MLPGGGRCDTLHVDIRQEFSMRQRLFAPGILAVAVFLAGALPAFAQPAPAPAIHIEPEPAVDPYSDSVGATAAQFRVDEAGAATYSMAIYAAPGTAGVAPEVTLAYGSRNPAGPLEIGRAHV